MPASILIADDDAAMRSLYARMFTGRGYSVALASTFSEASMQIASEDYDLLITDFMFTDGLGTELIKLFQRKQRRRAGRTMMVTGYPAAPGRERCPGVSVYFEKPFKVEDFMKAVEAALAA